MGVHDALCDIWCRGPGTLAQGTAKGKHFALSGAKPALGGAVSRRILDLPHAERLKRRGLCDNETRNLTHRATNAVLRFGVKNGEVCRIASQLCLRHFVMTQRANPVESALCIYFFSCQPPRLWYSALTNESTDASQEALK